MPGHAWYFRQADEDRHFRRLCFCHSLWWNAGNSVLMDNTWAGEQKKTCHTQQCGSRQLHHTKHLSPTVHLKKNIYKFSCNIWSKLKEIGVVSYLIYMTILHTHFNILAPSPKWSVPAVYLQCHAVYTAGTLQPMHIHHTLPASGSVPAVYVQPTLQLHCLYTPLRSGQYTCSICCRPCGVYIQCILNTSTVYYSVD